MRRDFSGEPGRGIGDEMAFKKANELRNVLFIVLNIKVNLTK